MLVPKRTQLGMRQDMYVVGGLHRLVGELPWFFHSSQIAHMSRSFTFKAVTSTIVHQYNQNHCIVYILFCRCTTQFRCNKTIALFIYCFVGVLLNFLKILIASSKFWQVVRAFFFSFIEQKTTPGHILGVKE